ncbi:hypothetical protein D9M69_734270 [compost metagenome]
MPLNVSDVRIPRPLDNFHRLPQALTGVRGTSAQLHKLLKSRFFGFLTPQEILLLSNINCKNNCKYRPDRLKPPRYYLVDVLIKAC